MIKITTLNIGLNTVKYMVFRDASAVSWGTLPLEGAVKNGVILEPAALGEKLRPLFSSGKLPRDRVIFSLNGLPFSYRFFTLPAMEPSALPEALARMAGQEMPLAPEDMYLSWRAYPAAGNERQFLVTGISRQPVDALIRMSTVAGVRPYLMCLPHISLAALTGRDNAIIADFEADYSNITLVVHGVPVGMHTIPAPGPEANLPDLASHLVRELTRMAGFYNDSHPGNPIPPTTPVLLTGELSGAPEVLRLIGEAAEYPVELLRELPANTVTVPPDAPLASFAVNIGDALQDGLPRRRPAADPFLVREINLQHITAEQAAVKKRPLSLKMLTITAFLVISTGALAAGYLSQSQTGAQAVQLRIELQQAREQLSQVQAASALAAKTTGDINAALANKQRLERENQLILNPRDSVADIRLLTRSLPPAATFNNIEVSPGQISINGITTSPEQVVTYVRSLEASGKFAAANIVWLDRYSGGKSPVITFLITIVR